MPGSRRSSLPKATVGPGREDAERVGAVARRDRAQQGVGQGDVEDGIVRARLRDELHYSCTKTVFVSR